MEAAANRLKAIQKTLKLLAEKRWLRIGVQGAIILVCLIYLSLQFRNAGGQLAGLRLDYRMVAAAWALTTAAVFLGAFGWWFTLKGLGLPAGPVPSVRSHLLSNLAKYLPGYAWQLVGKAYLTKQMGFSAGAVGLGMAIELGLLVWVGLGLAIALLPAGLALRWTGAAGQGVLLLRVAGLAALAGVPAASAAILARSRLYPSGLRPRPWALGAALLAILGGWLLFGFSFWLLGTALMPLSITQLPLFIFTLTSSFLIGLAILIVPGSFGVRESIMVFFLTAAQLPAGLAIVIAALSRVVVTLSELAGALIIEAILRIRAYSKSISDPLQKGGRPRPGSESSGAEGPAGLNVQKKDKQKNSP